jgi:5-methyltetrahydropteroyltriglutamate--homocysteine methyltransferase
MSRLTLYSCSRRTLLAQGECGGNFVRTANPRHEHESRIWEDLKLPAGKIIIPGVIIHCSNIVEYPELIRERLLRYAKLVAGENVMAAATGAFPQKPRSRRKFTRALSGQSLGQSEGAQIATKQLWS